MSMSKSILVVEDSQPDFEAIMRAFHKMKLESAVYHVESGEEALDFLTRQRKYKDPTSAPRPAVVLLDLNLPGLDGRSVLKRIKCDPELQSIPVVILTTSDSALDVDDCYKLGANSYMVKPVDWEKFMDSMNHFRAFWLQTSVLPGKELPA